MLFIVNLILHIVCIILNFVIWIFYTPTIDLLFFPTKKHSFTINKVISLLVTKQAFVNCYKILLQIPDIKWSNYRNINNTHNRVNQKKTIKSRNFFWVETTNNEKFSVFYKWRNMWPNKQLFNKSLKEDPIKKVLGIDQPTWVFVKLDKIKTGHLDVIQYCLNR